MNIAVLKMAGEPKPHSEACWLNRRRAEGEDSSEREELCSPMSAMPAVRPGIAGKCFLLPGWETGCAGEVLACKDIHSYEQMDTLDIRSQDIKPFPVLLSFDTMPTTALSNLKQVFQGNFAQHPRDF